MQLEVRFDESTKKWGCYVNGVLIGDSKNRFDADHAVAVLRRANESAVSN